MSIIKALKKNSIILTEASVIEKLRRTAEISLHPRLENATLIYDLDGKKKLQDIYRGYIDIAQRANFPINIHTPTWRANRERVLESDITKDINGEAVRFLSEVRDEREDFSSKILIGRILL